MFLLKGQLLYHEQLSLVAKVSRHFQTTALWRGNILDHGAMYSYQGVFLVDTLKTDGSRKFKKTFINTERQNNLCKELEERLVCHQNGKHCLCNSIPLDKAFALIRSLPGSQNIQGYEYNNPFCIHLNCGFQSPFSCTVVKPSE